MTAPLFAFAVRVAGDDSGVEAIVHHRTASQAKGEHWRSIRDFARFTDMRVRKVGPPQTSSAFTRTAIYRGMPDLRCGDRVRVGDAEGFVVGSNESANFDVLFDDDSIYPGMVLNCHPGDLQILQREVASV